MLCPLLPFFFFFFFLSQGPVVDHIEYVLVCYFSESELFGLG